MLLCSQVLEAHLLTYAKIALVSQGIFHTFEFWADDDVRRGATTAGKRGQQSIDRESLLLCVHRS
jgi:hypothetical protein